MFYILLEYGTTHITYWTTKTKRLNGLVVLVVLVLLYAALRRPKPIQVFGPVKPKGFNFESQKQRNFFYISSVALRHDVELIF